MPVGAVQTDGMWVSVMNTEEQYDDTFEAMLKRAQAGDTIAAKQVLQWTADALSIAAPIPNAIRAFLAEALWKIAHQGVDASTALNIKINRRPPKHDYVDLLRAAVRMRCYMDSLNEETQKKFTKKAAADYNASQAKYFKSGTPNAPTLTASAVENFYDANSSTVDIEAKKCVGGGVHKIQ